MKLQPVTSYNVGIEAPEREEPYLSREEIVVCDSIQKAEEAGKVLIEEQAKRHGIPAVAFRVGSIHRVSDIYVEAP